MFAGKTVTLVSHGHEKRATVEAVAGAGPSGYKALRLNGENVPHELDKVAGEPFWREGAPGEAKAAAEAAEEEAKPARKPRAPSARANRHKKK